MKSNIRLFALAILLLTPVLSLANQTASGFCTKGGVSVITMGTPSTNPVQGSFVGCRVQVNIHGGALATITDPNGLPLSNPFVASTDNGLWQFAAANGFYDLTIFAGTPDMGLPVFVTNLLLYDANTASLTQSSFTGNSFISSTALVATSGIFRCASVENCLVFRNNANGLDLAFKKTGAAAGNLPADVLDASAFGGIKVAQFFSNSALSAATGVLACAAGDTCVAFRNQGNSADIPGLAKDASDRIVIGGAAGFTASIGNITNGLTIGTGLTVGGTSALQGVTATTITASGEIAPSVTGGALGDTAHRFDAFVRNLDVSGTVTGFLTGSGTTNTIPKFTSANVINNSSITDNGITVSTSEAFAAASAAISGPITGTSLNLGATGALSTTAQSGTGSLCMTNNCIIAPASVTTGQIIQPAATALTIKDNAGGTRYSIPSGGVAQAQINNTALTGISTSNSVNLFSTGCPPQGPTTSITGTGAAADIFTCPLPANVIENNKILHVICSGVHDTGTANVTLNMNLNGQNFVNAATGTTASQSFALEAYILRTGTTTAQTWGFIVAGTPSAMVPFSVGLTGLSWTSGTQTLNCQFTVAATDHITGRVWAPMSIQ